MSELSTSTSANKALIPCSECGVSISRYAKVCPNCGNPKVGARALVNESPKSFGLAVILCAIFGTLGIHHFYLGNILHGLFDLFLFISAMLLFATGNGSLILFGAVLLIVDFFHTAYVMYQLFCGRTRDGKGRLVLYPGQLS